MLQKRVNMERTKSDSVASCSTSIVLGNLDLVFVRFSWHRRLGSTGVLVTVAAPTRGSRSGPIRSS